MGDQPTVTASTMITRFCWGHKVRCHMEPVEIFGKAFVLFRPARDLEDYLLRSFTPSSRDNFP